MGKKLVKCLSCGNEFETYNRKYCSRKCWYERNGPQKEVVCENCGKIFYITAKQRSGIKFCSNSCYREYTVGSKHPRYGHKLSKEERKNISKGVYRSIIENKHGNFVEELRTIMKDFKYYVLIPVPDAIAISPDGKVWAIEMERKNLERKIENWKNADHDFDGVIVFNELKEVRYRWPE